MEREALLRVAARRWSDAKLAADEAEKDAQAKRTSAENARNEANMIEKSLHDFVGRNERTKAVRVHDGTRIVMIQWREGQDSREIVDVSLLEVL